MAGVMGVSFAFAGEQLQLLPCGALLWPAQATLLVADLHLEKASHHARRGWLLPPHASANTLAALIDAVETSGATRVVCLGDSFHDGGGPDRLLPAARAALGLMVHNLDWWWITGNHDDDAAGALGGQVRAQAQLGPFTLRHAAVPGDPAPELSGHFHPKLVIRHRGRHIARRCAALGGNRLILPAFGTFTGGLDIADPAIRGLLGSGARALVMDRGRLLEFPLA